MREQDGWDFSNPLDAQYYDTVANSDSRIGNNYYTSFCQEKQQKKYFFGFARRPVLGDVFCAFSIEFLQSL